MITKANILQEIKRTAEANGGKPHGAGRLEVETGIKKSDWFPEYWIRFGDAQRDAGYTPNQLNTKFEQTKLFEKCAILARELGHLPVKGELIRERRNDLDFPHWYTFSPKPEFIGQLLAYCQSREKYDDVVRMCERYVPRQQNISDTPRLQKKEMGFVYLNKSGGFYYIGQTNCVGRRKYEHDKRLPGKVTEIHRIPTPHPVGAEKYWQERFAAKHDHGSW